MQVVRFFGLDGRVRDGGVRGDEDVVDGQKKRRETVDPLAPSSLTYFKTAGGGHGPRCTKCGGSRSSDSGYVRLKLRDSAHR